MGISSFDEDFFSYLADYTTTRSVALSDDNTTVRRYVLWSWMIKLFIRHSFYMVLQKYHGITITAAEVWKNGERHNKSIYLFKHQKPW